MISPLGYFLISMICTIIIMVAVPILCQDDIDTPSECETCCFCIPCFVKPLKKARQTVGASDDCSNHVRMN